MIEYEKYEDGKEVKRRLFFSIYFNWLQFEIVVSTRYIIRNLHS